jgi:hypothetical protein
MSTEITTGTDLVREALRGRNRKLNLAGLARSLGLPADRLENFAEGKVTLPAETMQAIVKALWGEHTEFDAEADALRPSNRTPPTPLGVHPPKFESVPLNFQTGAPPPQSGYAPAQPKKPRPGWLGGWL